MQFKQAFRRSENNFEFIRIFTLLTSGIDLSRIYEKIKNKM